MAMGIHCADHVTPSLCKKLALASPTSGGWLVGIVCLWTKATEFSFSLSSFLALYFSQFWNFFFS
jgi:hypothetical protein